MKTKHLTFVAAMLLGAMTVRAQTPPAGVPSDQAVPPPPPPASAPTYGYGYGYTPGFVAGTPLAGAVTFPYAFNWDAVGVSAELGGLLQNSQFLGGEVSYYGGDDQLYNVYHNSDNTYAGHFRSSTEVTTLQFAYRYFGPRWELGPWVPVTFYAGASAGAGYVNFSNDGAVFGFRNDDNWHFSGELLAGFQFHAGRNATFRIGYRYIYLDNVRQFDERASLGSNAIEAGFGFRF